MVYLTYYISFRIIISHNEVKFYIHKKLFLQNNHGPMESPNKQVYENIIISNKNLSLRMNPEEIQDRIFNYNNLETKSYRNDLPFRKPLLVEVSKKTRLIAPPSLFHDIYFDITNTLGIRVIYTIIPKSSNFAVINYLPFK